MEEKDYLTGSQFDATYTGSEQSDSDLLKTALINEKAAPEILQYETDLIDRIYAQIEYQEQLITEAEQNPDLELLSTIYTMELTRVRYMLRAYLRTRLHKIERYVMHCIDNAEVRARLSPKEDSYAEQYLVLVGNHLRNTVTSKLPAAFSSLVKQASAHPANDMIATPDLSRHVFCRVLQDLGQVQVYEDGGTHELNKGDLYIMRYRMLRNLLHEGSVQLV